MTRKLFIAARSPFARKARIVLLEKGLPFELAVIDLTARTPEFVSISPLGKVPVLRDEDGTVVFDSTVITEYLEDRYPDRPMFGIGMRERLLHRVFDELADTAAESAIALFMGRNGGDAAALAKASMQLQLALGEASARIERGAVPVDFGVGHAAMISALGYIEFRLGAPALAPYPAIARWLAPQLGRRSVLDAPGPQA